MMNSEFIMVVQIPRYQWPVQKWKMYWNISMRVPRYGVSEEYSDALNEIRELFWSKKVSRDQVLGSLTEKS